MNTAFAAIDPSQWYSVAHAAKLLGRSPAHVRNLFDRGQLSGLRLSDGTRAASGASLLQEKQRIESLEAQALTG